MTEIETQITAGETTSEQQRIPGDRSAPVLFAWLASAVTVVLIVATQFLPQGGDPILRGAGACLLLLAGVLIFWPLCLLTRHRGREGQAHMQARCAVRRGPYAVARHPQYLGYTLLAWGFALLSGHWIAFLLAMAGSTLFYLQALREERYCLAQFGESYQQYRRRVPRYNAVLGIVRLLRGGGR